MDYLSTLPRRSWLDQLRLVLAVTVVIVGVAGLAGVALKIDFLSQPLANMAGITANEALCLAVLGSVMIAREVEWKPAGWIAIVPLAFGLAMIVEGLFDRDLHIDELIVRDFQATTTGLPGRSSSVTGMCILLTSATLIWSLFKHATKARLYAEAVTGSVLISAGFSTLVGYAASLPAVYNWGTSTPMPALTAIGFFMIGTSLLILAWRDSASAEEGPPAWAPMPAAIGCLTLTVIMWVGLREREFAYLSATTLTTADSIATHVSLEIEQQTNSFERLARQWADQPGDAKAIWGADAKLQLQSSGEVGCVSIAIADTAPRTQWMFPEKQNYETLGFDHRVDNARREAVEAVETHGAPAVSGTTDIGMQKLGGFAVYAPITRGSRISGFVVADFLYKPFFSTISKRLNLQADYDLSITIGSVQVYESTPEARQADRTLAQDKVYTIFDRRVRITLIPTAETISRGRRYLPELALAAGVGITLLLGLSIHLARRSRAGQRAAELSNKKLVAENEERRRVEARLKVSDERLRLALDSTQIGILEWNVSSGHIYYSPGLWALLGYEHSRMPATLEAWQSLIHTEDFPAYRRRVESQLNGIATFIDPEYRVRARTGEWRWVYMRAKSVTIGPNGRPSRIIGTVQDITARRESEQALRESQAEARKLSLVAARTDNPVLICSPDGRIEWVNEAFTRVMEYSLEEVVGRDPSVLMAGPDTDPKVIGQFHSEIEHGQGMSADLVHYSKSGRKYYLHVEMQAVRNKGGQLENFIIIENDITARVEMENNLRRAKVEADAASRAKSEFLASMSHEIRTPMNGVIGMTSLLTETHLSNEQRDFVQTIRSSGEALLTIINDILDFSKIESGKMELERIPFELTQCLEEALDLFSLQAASKNLEIAYHVEPDVPAWIVGDVTRLRQVLVNLVNNAVKFTPSGSITIVVRRIMSGHLRAVDPTRARLEFAIRDTGIGIPPDRIDRLFKAFSQVDSSTTRKYGGTGLGLAICQRLSQLMGGDIRVESELGSGSTFLFTILAEPTSIPSDATPPPAPPAPLRGQLVLCVEDNTVVQSRLKVLVESWGATCVIAPDIDSAAQVSASLPVPPALLVLDAGDSGTKESKATLAALKCPRLFMLPFGHTTTSIPEDGQPTASITKPLKTGALIQAIGLLFNPVAKAAAEAARKETRLLAEEVPLNVLLAEDNPVNQKVAKRFLERLGYQADAVGNGLEAVTTLESRHYDLVLMDLQMPEMDGLEASREIRRRLPANRQPKIVALTANAMQGDRELCIAAGMDDYVSKPVKIHEIAAAIRRQFQKKPDGTPAGQPEA